MAVNRENALVDITGKALNRRIQDQKWYQENANFVTTIAGFLGTVAGWLATLEFSEDPKVQFGILILGFLATTFGVKKTRNGFSKSQQAKIQHDQAKEIGNTPLVVGDEPDLDAEVREYNKLRSS